MYYLKIKKAELVQAKFGFDIKISMIGLYHHTDEGEHKWIKWVKLNERTMEILVSWPMGLTSIQAIEMGVL